MHNIWIMLQIPKRKVWQPLASNKACGSAPKRFIRYNSRIVCFGSNLQFVTNCNFTGLLILSFNYQSFCPSLWDPSACTCPSAVELFQPSQSEREMVFQIGIGILPSENSEIGRWRLHMRRTKKLILFCSGRFWKLIYLTMTGTGPGPGVTFPRKR